MSPTIRRLIATSSVVLLVSTIAVTAKEKEAHPENSQSEIQRGLSLSPVALNLLGKNRALVARGSYLVNASGGCIGCHTAPHFVPGGSPFLGEPEQINSAGFMGGGAAFGPFISRNLTPNFDGNPGGLTLDQFKHVIRTGRDLKALPPPVPSPANDLLQVMPWVGTKAWWTKTLRPSMSTCGRFPASKAVRGWRPDVARLRLRTTTSGGRRIAAGVGHQDESRF